MGCNVYLVPGFFGFTELGTISYFYRVRETLDELLRQRGTEATIVECLTSPAGSIRYRADRLLQQVIDTGGLQADEIHFIGHSTGGLDIRLLLTPNVTLRPDGSSEAEVVARTGCAITVATPHHGTPLADFFTLVPGRQMLQTVARLVTTPMGRFVIVSAARGVALAAAIDSRLRRDTFLDVISRLLLRHLTLHDDDPVFAFVRQVSVDQASILQVTPECMDLFNAAVVDHPDVDYSCVVTGAPEPPAAYSPSDLLSPERLALGGLFLALWTLTSREHKRFPYPVPPAPVLDALAREIERAHSPATNDGIIPTLSQVHGEVLGAFTADHYDVLGRFGHPTSPPLSDWLPSGTGFDETRFRDLWERVADRIAGRCAARRAPAA
jgi:triacylglycerol lipase